MTKKSKILINRKPIEGPWGGGNNFVSAFVHFASMNGHEIVYSLENDIDYFFVVDPRPDKNSPGLSEVLNSTKHKNIKIVQRINECDARKNTEHMDPLLLSCSQYVYKTIFVSKWMANYFGQKGWQCKNNYYVHNGVNLETFKPVKLTKRKIPSVVAHHWSNNLLKGFDAYEFLDYLASKGLIEFTYIGRHRNTFQNTNCVEPCTGKKLAENLANHDLYISASRFDPGPNHILEAIASGLPTYVHADGGGAVEFAGEDHTFNNLIELEKLVLGKNYVKNNFSPVSWENSISGYLNAML